MQENYDLVVEKKDLKCTANEVSAVLVDYQGPNSCVRGEFVELNFTASITFNTDLFGESIAIL